MNALKSSTVAFIACLVLQLTAASGKELTDGGKFFSAEAKQQALERIGELEKKHDLEIDIETFATVPNGQADRVKAMSEKERNAYFSEWLKTLAHKEHANGIFILICREPSHLRVGVSKSLHKRGLTDRDRDAIAAAFRDKKFDEGLMAAISQIGLSAQQLSKAGTSPIATQRPSSPMAPAASGSMNWGGLVCLGVAALLLVFVVASVIGAFFRGGSSGGMPGQGYGGGFGGGYGGGMGGGLLGNLLGGFGGAMLGNWVYDQWSGGGHAHAGEPGAPTSFGDSSGDSNYQDFGSSGGDFDSSGGTFGSGGGDFGGGGGDFGGGDFGGDSGGDF